MLSILIERLGATDTDIRGSGENPCSSALGTWRQHKEQTLDRAIKWFKTHLYKQSYTESHMHEIKIPKFSCSLLSQ